MVSCNKVVVCPNKRNNVLMMVLLPLGAAITEGEHHVTIGLVRVPVDTHTHTHTYAVTHS